MTYFYNSEDFGHSRFTQKNSRPRPWIFIYCLSILFPLNVIYFNFWINYDIYFNFWINYDIYFNFWINFLINFFSGDGRNDRGEDLPASADQTGTRRGNLGPRKIRVLPTVSLLFRLISFLFKNKLFLDPEKSGSSHRHRTVNKIQPRGFPA